MSSRPVDRKRHCVWPSICPVTCSSCVRIWNSWLFYRFAVQGTQRERKMAENKTKRNFIRVTQPILSAHFELRTHRLSFGWIWPFSEGRVCSSSLWTLVLMTSVFFSSFLSVVLPSGVDKRVKICGSNDRFHFEQCLEVVVNCCLCFANSLYFN